MKTISSIELKQINRGKVYRLIYEEKRISKHEITKVLNMSLPTVSLYLSELADLGMIQLAGFSESTGGRPATLYECNPLHKIAFGLEILAGEVNLIAMNIIGSVLLHRTHPIKFSHATEYYRQVGNLIDAVMTEMKYSPESVLGVTISIQGLVSSDGENVTYSKILGAEGITLSDFTQFMIYPCTLIHDTSAAAYAEIRYNRKLNDSIFISLNRFFGSALIINGELFKGRDLCGSTIEHMVLHQEGMTCYCQKRGCVQVFCSGEALELASQKSIPDFFELLAQRDQQCASLWDKFIQDLALMINNARMVIDCDIILGGEIATKISEHDLERLMVLIKANTTFPFSEFSVSTSTYGKEATIIGGAMLRIDAFLNAYLNF